MPKTLEELTFENRFTRELPGDTEESTGRRQVLGACYSRVQPTPVANPQVVAFSREVCELLELDERECRRPEFASIFGGNALLPGMDPFAMCYGGHQFGNWAGQLGDGRAINLGEVLTDSGQHFTLQLKGAGPTPYSRMGDGLAVLRSSVREFLCSEAMFHLGVPTTRALSLVRTGDHVMRDMFYDGNAKLEPGAVVCRVAESFVRFGNFQIFAARKDLTTLRKLVDFTIRSDFPHLLNGDAGSAADNAVIAEWFGEVCRRTADLIVHWMRVGFVHGVLNTDNMSILGQTIDYGPYGWLDDYDPNWTPNTTDASGRRYRFGNQPAVAHWNLFQLANALVQLTGDAAPLEEALEQFVDHFESRAAEMVYAKLGLPPDNRQPGDDELRSDLWDVLQLAETDMTIFFRALADLSAGTDTASPDALLAPFAAAWYQPAEVAADGETRDAISAWLARYVLRVRLDKTPDQQRRERMNRVNPRYVLRNYLAQQAIDLAEAGDNSLVQTLLEVLRHPYDEQPENERFAAKRPEWARDRAGCSTLSCSS